MRILILCSLVIWYSINNLVCAQVSFTPMPFDSLVNSSQIETRPYISGNGKSLIFGIRQSDINVAGQRGVMDLYIARMGDNGQWLKPQNLGTPVNFSKCNALAAASKNDSCLYVLNTFNFRNIPIYITCHKEGVWGEHQPVHVDDYYNTSRFVDIHVNDQLGTMVLAIERRDSRGDQDLYVSFRKEANRWTQPQNLGKDINTQDADFSPFLSADGLFLFFASFGHDGEGADIFVSYRIDDSWENWTPPMNLGEGINTKDDEVYVSVTDDLQLLYLETCSTETDNRQISQISIPESLREMMKAQAIMALEK